MRSTSARIWPYFGQIRPRSAKVGRVRSKADPKLSKADNLWSTLGRIPSNVVQKSAKLGPHRSKFGRSQPELGKIGPTLVELSPRLVSVGPNLAERGPKLVDFGPDLGDIGPSRSSGADPMPKSADNLRASVQIVCVAAEPPQPPKSRPCGKYTSNANKLVPRRAAYNLRMQANFCPNGPNPGAAPLGMEVKH